VRVIEVKEVWYEQVQSTTTTNTIITKQYPFSCSFPFGLPIVLVGYENDYLSEVCLGSVDWERFGEGGVFSMDGRTYSPRDPLARMLLAMKISGGLTIMPVPIEEKNVTMVPFSRLTYQLTLLCVLRSRITRETFTFTQHWESEKIQVILPLTPAKYRPSSTFTIGEVELIVEPLNAFTMTPIYYTFTKTLVQTTSRTITRTRLKYVTLTEYLLGLNSTRATATATLTNTTTTTTRMTERIDR
jgi:hypothetical protein